MAYCFDEADAPERHETQYFEMFGNRAIYHLGWTAVAKHKDPWLGSSRTADEDPWELYNVEEDWTQSNDLAAEQPEKLAELQRLFLIQAARFNVLPLDVRSAERFNPDLVGRPVLIEGTSQTLYPGMKRLVGEQRHQHQEQVAHDHRRNRGTRRRRRRRDHRPGRRVRWLVACSPSAACSSTATTCSASRPTRSPPTHRCPPASRRSASSSPTTVVGSARAAPCTCRRTAPRSARDASSERCRSSSPSTRPSTSDATPPRRCLPSTGSPGNEFTGTIKWVRIDLGDDSHDHLDPEAKLQAALIKQ